MIFVTVVKVFRGYFKFPVCRRYGIGSTKPWQRPMRSLRAIRGRRFLIFGFGDNHLKNHRLTIGNKRSVIGGQYGERR